MINKRGQNIKSKISPVSLIFSKQGQTQISFGTIFSVILIIIFIVFAVYGIGKFLSTVNYAKIEKFGNDFQKDIDDMWKSTRGGNEHTYLLPGKVRAVCFRENENGDAEMYFEPFKLKYNAEDLKHIDIEKTIEELGNSPCISTSNGKLSLVIKKDINTNLVVIKRTSSS